MPFFTTCVRAGLSARYGLAPRENTTTQREASARNSYSLNQNTARFAVAVTAMSLLCVLPLTRESHRVRGIANLPHNVPNACVPRVA